MATTTRTKTKNKPSLKSKGAGYSTTNSKGVTTYYKSAKDASGYSDTADGKNVKTSTGKGLSQVDANGQVITSDKLSAPSLVFPKPPTPDPLKGVTDMNNASLGGANYDATKKQFTTPPTTDTNSFDTLKQYLGDNAKAFSDVPTQESLVKEQQKYLKPKEDLANSLQGQLNTITTNRDAEMLKLEGQGRGQTSGFVGGEQARISREATIQAMPIQAQLAIAQSDLESARSYASQLFQAKSQDALARYNYQKELNGTIFNYLNESEKRRLAQVEREQDRAFQVERDNRNSLETLANFAIDNRQSALSAEIMRIDPTSPTYREEVAKVRARLQKYVAPTGPVKRDTQFNANGDLVDMQTGEIITTAGGNTQQGGVQKSLDQISFLQTTIKDAKGLVDATGPNLITKGLGNVFIGNTRVKQLATKLDTLKTNLLTLNSDPALKKFFGPQMTEKDTQLLMSAGSTLNAYDSSEADNRAELKRYEDLLNRMQTAIKNGGGTTFGIVLTGADGLQYQITD